VRTRYDNDLIKISFIDNGPGVPEENIKKIFDPFFTTKEVGKGTGLGLSICYGLIQGHGGTIHAENNQGGGAAFVIELPVTSETNAASDIINAFRK